MDNLRLLIVDDDADNRLVLKAICKKLDGFEFKEAVDGLEALDVVASWEPHIVLMDIMMPNMDGFEASKIIKEKYPQIVIIVVTAVMDSNVQDKMSSIGVDVYIHKPIDRELIRYKLQSIGSSINSKRGQNKALSSKNALNPFNSDIRSFKTFFDITDTEAMMDFGMWLFDQFNGKSFSATNKFDMVLDVFYKLMSKGNENGETMSIIVEESYEEFYITIKFEQNIDLDERTAQMIKSFKTEFIIQDNVICVKLNKPQDISFEIKETVPASNNISTISPEQEIKETITEEKIETKNTTKEVRAVNSKERELLHQSFVDKTSAVEYVNDIGGDILDEILDLSSIEQEWEATLGIIEKDPTKENLISFVERVLNNYTSVINNLFEFTALAYALSSLSSFIKESADSISQDSKKTKTLIMLLEHLGEDLASWREHIFVLQDTADIHYLDSSFFSSCMQIEGIISDKNIGEDDDNDMEFF